MKRVFIIVLDGLGVGELPDAADYGDVGSNTLRSVVSTGLCEAPNLEALGLFNIEGDFDRPGVPCPAAAHGRLRSHSAGKDTTTGHWELASLVSHNPMPTYPDGFPREILDRFSELTGRGVLCNKPYSGTQVIYDYGREQLKTGALIVYTSADSVFQIAAHEDMVPPEQLYEYCRMARGILTGKHAVGRVIARPYKGVWPDYVRTPRRHDFSVEPHGETVLDRIKAAGFDVISVGKINDIFAGRGITESHPTLSNSDGMDKTAAIANRKDWSGLCFVNLVEFDSLYGHRNDAEGFARAVSEFDMRLSEFRAYLRPDDLLIITADHGCDPLTPSTDHSREYVPVIVYGCGIDAIPLGTRDFSDVGATAAHYLGIEPVSGRPLIQ